LLLQQVLHTQLLLVLAGQDKHKRLELLAAMEEILHLALLLLMVVVVALLEVLLILVWLVVLEVVEGQKTREQMLVVLVTHLVNHLPEVMAHLLLRIKDLLVVLAGMAVITAVAVAAVVLAQ
jgi:hypothetical protein